MPEFKPKYTAGDIVTMWLEKTNEGQEARIRYLAEQFRAMCRLENEMFIPGEYAAIAKEVRTPFIRDAWSKITSSMVAKPPVEHAEPVDEENEDYRESANITERFDTAMLERLNKERGTDLAYNTTAMLVRDGESVLKVVHRPSAWANFPTREENPSLEAGKLRQKQEEYKRAADLPIAIREVDRTRMLFEDGEYGDMWAMEYAEFATPWLRSRYGYDQDPSTGYLVNPLDSISGPPMPEGLLTSSSGRRVRIEFFDAEEWHVVVDGAEAPGWPKRNPYAPHLPYHRARAYESESLLYSLMFLVPRLDELLTMKQVWSVLGAYANPILETVPNMQAYPALDVPVGDSGETGVDPEAGQKPFKWRPGMMLELPVGKKFSFATPPPVGKDLNDMVTLYKNLIDVAGIPAIMRGMAGSGDSGYLANQLHAAAEMGFKLAVLALQRQMESAIRQTHWIITNIVGQTVYAHGWQRINPKTGKPNTRAGKAWLGVNPEKASKNVADLSKVAAISFQFRPTLPTDQQARAMIAMQLTNAQKPLMDRRTALETWLQEEDADSILRAIRVEQALEEEPLKSMVRQKALERAGIVAPPQPQQSGLVGPNGNPLASMLPPGPGNLQGVPLANQAPPGMPGVPGLTMPIQPGVPQAPSVQPGVSVPGGYPGQPGGPGNG